MKGTHTMSPNSSPSGTPRIPPVPPSFVPGLKLPVLSVNGISPDESGDVRVYDPEHYGYVPETRKINGKPLSSDITLQPSDIGAAPNSVLNEYVPMSRTVNGKPLSSDVTLQPSDIGAAPSSVLNEYVPMSRTVNGKPLSSDITLQPSDIGAAADSDVALTPVYSDTPKYFTDWVCTPPTAEYKGVTGRIRIVRVISAYDNQDGFYAELVSESDGKVLAEGLPSRHIGDPVVSLVFEAGNRSYFSTVATRTPLPSGYRLGSQIDSVVATAGQGARADNSVQYREDVPTAVDIGLRSTYAAAGKWSVAEGHATAASGAYSHAEGRGTSAGDTAHAEGFTTAASGKYSHAEGAETDATGECSHAEGSGGVASGYASHTEGISAIALNMAEHAQGQHNYSHSENGNSFGLAGNTLSSIGFGLTDAGRKNAVETMQDGKTFIYGLGGYDGTNPTSSTDLATVIKSKIGPVLTSKRYDFSVDNDVKTAIYDIVTALGGEVTNFSA